MAAAPPSPEAQQAMRDADSVDQKKLTEVVVVASVFAAISCIFVGLRLLSRCVFIRSPKVDDYLIVAALVGVLGYLTCVGVGAANHMGFPFIMISLDNMTAILKATLAIEVLYYTIVFLIKASILCTYLRFAVSETFRNLCHGTIALHAVFYVICVVITLLQCQPLHKMWDLMGTTGGWCINTTAFFYSTSGFHIATDIWILLLPLKTLSSIQRPRREKIALFAIFGCGTFACIASMVRLHTIYRYTLSDDPFRDATLINLWSMLEVNIAICCASVSALKPVFSRSQRLRSTGRRTGAGSSARRPRHAPSGISGLSRTGDSGSGASRGRSAAKRGLWDPLGGGGSVATATTATDVEAAEVTPFPPTRPLPPLADHSGSTSAPTAVSTSRHTLDPESPEMSEDGSSMFVFTPLSPPGRPGARLSAGPVGADGVNSSGSLLVIQKPQ